MEETDFHRLADATLEKLAAELEKADSTGDLEVEYIDGILNIEIPSSKQYVINKHAPMRQIWLASPISGAAHFFYDGGKWVSSGGLELENLLRKELAGITKNR